jgi:hypothetical protein
MTPGGAGGGGGWWCGYPGNCPEAVEVAVDPTVDTESLAALETPAW